MNSAFLPPITLPQTTTSSSSSFATRPRKGTRRATPAAVATSARKSQPAAPVSLPRLSSPSATAGMAKASMTTEANRARASKEYGSRKPRTATAAPEAGARSSNSRKSSSSSSSSSSGGAPVLTESELKRHLAERHDTSSVTVVQVFASYCASCRGAAGPFRKVMAAYAGEGVSFAKLDFAANEQFARDALGVDNLPYFAVFRGSRREDGSAMGWRGLGSRLVERIEAVRDAALAE